MTKRLLITLFLAVAPAAHAAAELIDVPRDVPNAARHVPQAVLTCSELVAQMRQLRPAEQALSLMSNQRTDPGDARGAAQCRSVASVPRRAQLEILRVNWDRASRSWEIFARCVHPSDCLPFLVSLPQADYDRFPNLRSPGDGASWRAANRQSAFEVSGSAERVAPIVRPGQAVTLLWEQKGIRLRVRAVSLDPGACGWEVRARVPGGHLVRAIVVSAGLVHAGA